MWKCCSFVRFGGGISWSWLLVWVLSVCLLLLFGSIYWICLIFLFCLRFLLRCNWLFLFHFLFYSCLGVRLLCSIFACCFFLLFAVGLHSIWFLPCLVRCCSFFCYLGNFFRYLVFYFLGISFFVYLCFSLCFFSSRERINFRCALVSFP